MLKNKFERIKTAAVSGIIALAAVAAPFSPTVAAPLSSNAAGSDNYAKLLQYSLYFYDANMCGKNVNETSLLTWRGDCHTSDSIDGGFHDAGDHVMFGLPQGYTASTLGWSYHEFSDAFKAVGEAGHYQAIANYFCDFFINSATTNGNSITEFCIEKGEGNQDHSYWGPPENQGGGRPILKVSSGSGDIAAEYAAALAANYCNFGREQDLKYAKMYYEYAKRNASPTFRATFYESEGCGDDLAWAAGWLALATNDNSYKSDLQNGSGAVYWCHCWNNVTLGAACLRGEVLGDWSYATGWLNSTCSGNDYFFQDEWGSARYNCAAQLAALVATKHGKGSYDGWAKNQMNMILGDNPINVCFVVGFSSNSASKPHHRACSGTDTAENEAPSKYTLVGALVGGPTDRNWSYQDKRADYKANEVAIDYNAGLVGAAAGLYHFYKTGTTDSNVPGAKSNPYSDPEGPQQTTATTNYNPGQQTTTTTTNPQTGGDGKYSAKIGESYDFNNMTDKMVGWEWSTFGIPSGEHVIKVDVNISSASGGSIGKWEGAFGSSTSVAAENYWTQSDNMTKTISGNSGTITWEPSSSVSNIIQLLYNGELKFGTWWADCGKLNIDSVTVYTDGKGSSPVTTTSTTATTRRTTTTTTTTTVRNDPTQVLAGDANNDGYVAVSDAILILQSLANPSKYQLSDQGKANADCQNKGNGVDAQDALAIQKYAAGLINVLPTNR